MQLYFKYLNSYGPVLGNWWLYVKVILDNKDRETCQVFKFEKTSREINQQFCIGMDKPFLGSIDTNSYKYYCDLYEPCTKEEFEKELKIFMDDLNAYVQFLNYSP